MGEYDLIGALIGALGDDGDETLEDLLVSGLGNTELIGGSDGDDDDMFGAIGASIIGRAKGPQKKAAARKLLKKIAMKNAGAVVQKALKEKRRFPIGFALTSLPASGSATIPTLPQNLFRGERTLIPSDIAFDIGVTDIKVGNQSQFVQSSEVPGAAYSEVAIDTEMHYDTAEVGNQVSIAVRNKDTANAVDFTGCVIGIIAKP